MSFSDKAEDTAKQAKGAAKDLAKQSSGVVSALHNLGIRSEYAYAAGVASNTKIRDLSEPEVERLRSEVGKFVVEGEGAIMIDGQGVRAGDDDAEVTLTASRDTFEGILNGDTNPTMAYMTGKLKIDGSLPAAMKLGAALS